jgi:thiamine-monophosphate kinase
MPEEGRIAAGEEAIVQSYFAPLAQGFPGAFGLKDDCALLAPPPGHELVLTTDALAEGVHFIYGDAPEDVAWKAIAVNVSDLVAKGAAPLVYLMSLAFPEAPATEYLRRFASGLAAAQARFRISLAGGDTDRRPGPMSVTVTAVGTVPAGSMVRRATARAADRILVSGTIGDAILGLKLRRDMRLAAGWGLGAAEADRLISRSLRPEPPLAVTEPLRAFAQAAMDISDGLAKDLGRMANASGVGAHVSASSLPLSAAAARALAAEPGLLADLVSGGEDYEVLAAVSPADVAPFTSAAVARGITLTEIGEFVQDSGLSIAGPDGRPLALAREGWDHFFSPGEGHNHPAS